MFLLAAARPAYARCTKSFVRVDVAVGGERRGNSLVRYYRRTLSKRAQRARSHRAFSEKASDRRLADFYDGEG